MKKNLINDLLSIVDYSEKELGLNIVFIGTMFYIKQFTDTVIFPQTNSFYRFSSSQGGGIIEFIKEFDLNAKNSIAEAKKIAINYIEKNKPKRLYLAANNSLLPHIEDFKMQKEFLNYLNGCTDYYKSPKMPIKTLNNSKILEYFYKNKISKKIINSWMAKDIIYQDEEDNIVYLGKDFNNNNKYVQINLKDNDFKIVKNSKKYVGLFYSGLKNEVLFIVDDVLEAMSIQQILKNDNYNYLVIEKTDPLYSVLFFLQTRKINDLKIINICFNSTKKQIKKAQKIKEKLLKIDQIYDFKNNIEINIIFPKSTTFNNLLQKGKKKHGN